MENNNEYPIRIAVVMGKYVTGGIRSVIWNYYMAMDKNKIQFDLLVDKNSPDNDYEVFVSKGAKVYEITAIEKNPIRNIIETRRILKNNNYSIVHGYLNTLNIFPMFAGFLAGTKIRIAENLSTAHPREPKSKIKNLLKPFASFFATNLAANSIYSAEWIYGKVKAKKTIILRNGLNLDDFIYSEKLRIEKRQSLGLSDEFLIGHIGRYHFQKNHEFLIDVFSEIVKKNPQSRLLLIGYGELKGQIWKKIEELRLTEYVIDGGASVDNIANYNAMDCFLMTSFYEGLPVVGIEAQSTGLPCVFSNEITEEVKVIAPVSFLSLDKDKEFWADEVLKMNKQVRENSTDKLRLAGYDIKEEANNLSVLYETLYYN